MTEKGKSGGRVFREHDKIWHKPQAWTLAWAWLCMEDNGYWVRLGLRGWWGKRQCSGAVQLAPAPAEA